MRLPINVEEGPRVLVLSALTLYGVYFRYMTALFLLYSLTVFAYARIRVLTYNIFARPPLIHNNLNDYKNERLKLFEEELDRFDVICLQEMFALGSGRQSRLRDAARRKGLVHQVTGAAPPLFSLKFIDSGLLILSRFPIVETDAHMYSHGFQIDGYAAKQVVYARIQVSTDPHGDLHMFTTHMQASYRTNSDEVNELNDRARMEQVTELAQFVRRCVRDRPGVVLVAGDFNVDARAQDGLEYQQMLQRLRTSGYAVTDLLHAAHLPHPHCHPVTYADVDPAGRPRDVVLTAVEDHGTAMCLDYMFLLEHRGPWPDAAPPPDPAQAAQAAQAEREVRLEGRAEDERVGGAALAAAVRTAECVLEARVEPFFVSEARQPFAQLSDHYGVSALLTVPAPRWRASDDALLAV